MRSYIVLMMLFVLVCNTNAQNQEQLYQDALTELRLMLQDSATLSFKKAVLLTENAYLQGSLDTIGFNDEIKRLKLLAQALIKSRTLLYQGKDSASVKKSAAIYTILTDTIPIKSKTGEIFQYIPYTYDFEDIWGLKNWESMFVTKLLATGKGNCHSMPYLYKILAEEFNIPAHLAIAPNHVYIKQKNLKNGWFNTELTSGVFPVDAWLMASGYIHLDAITNKMYMEALNDKQSIAMCVIDLAQGYNHAFPDNDGVFVLEACEIALKQYPHYINGRILVAETKKAIFERAVKKEYGTFSNEFSKNELLRNVFLELQDQYALIHKDGYRQMPEDMYLDWLTSLVEERSKYENKTLTN